MSFNAADLVAKIQLGGVETAARDLDRFRGKLNDTDSVASKLGKTAEATFRGAAVTIGVASAAAAAYVTKLFATGVAYNQLQQTSRAALKTLVGGAEQANAQMDKLDAFAKTSPFSKSVFISAQQQLIGFGMQAQKVIPTLDAMQDAVAAVGGSNQQLGDLVFILAQIQAAGKITGEDLMQFGQRGIDAASLIGSQMGKTGAQIREEITKGTLGATDAVDALVAGMKQKFGGSAANVKETFAGTVDRIRAASRDIGSALAEPFVSKNGGGLAVTWGNQVADIMRAVEKHTTPVVAMLTSRAAPAFASITEELDKAGVQVRSWDSSRLERGLDAMSDHAPGLAALAGAVLGVNSQLLASIPVLGRFVPAFGPVGGAIAAAALASPELRTELGALLGELKPLIPVTVSLASTLSGGLNAALPVVASGIRLVTGVAGPFVDLISKIPSPMLATAGAAVAVFMAMRSGGPAIQGFVDGIRRIAEMAAVQQSLAGMDGNTSRLAGTFGIAGKAATGLGNSLKAAFISNPVGWIILGVSTAAGILTAALSAQGQKAQETKERIRGYRETLTAAGEATAATVDKIRQAITEFAEVETNLFTNDTVEVAKDWVAEIGGAERALMKFGTTSTSVAAAIRDGGSAYDELLSSLSKYGTETEKINTTGGTKDQLTESANAANLLREKVVEQREAVRLAAEIQADYNRRMQEAAAAMTDAERSNTRLNEALAIARDVSRDATERLNALKQALDELNGGTKTQAELTRDLNEQALNLADAFAQTDDAGNSLAKSLVKSSGEIDTTTRAGVALHDQVVRLNDDMVTAITQAVDFAKENGNAAGAMEAGTAAARPYIDKLREIATGAGLSSGQVDGLVRTMMDTPSLVSFLVSDDGTIDLQKQRLLQLAQQVLATPDGSFTVDDGDSIYSIQTQLERMGFKVTHLPDGKVTVTAAGVASVEQALTRLARDRSAKIYVTTSGVIKSGSREISAGGWATGGPVFGPGSGTSDDVPAMLSNGEHVVTTAEVNAAGGHGAMMRIRQAILDGSLRVPHLAGGGPVFPLRATEQMLQVARPTSAPVPVGLGAAGLEALIAEIRTLRAALGRPNVSLSGNIDRDWLAAIRELRDDEGTEGIG